MSHVPDGPEGPSRSGPVERIRYGGDLHDGAPPPGGGVHPGARDTPLS